MADAWDADDFEPSTDIPAVVKTDRWDGEDEDDNVKDAWDAESGDDENKEYDPNMPRAIQRKKKKKLADILAEKEEQEAARLEALRKEEEAKQAASTPEGRLAEKLRRQKIEEDSNLQLAKDMMGLKSTAGSIDSMMPVTKDEFDQFEKAIVEKVNLFATSSHYNDFIESLTKNLCLDLNPTMLKKVKINVEALHTAKLKEEKAQKAKGKGKGKGGSLKMDLDKDLFSSGAGGSGYDDMDDFM